METTCHTATYTSIAPRKRPILRLPKPPSKPIVPQVRRGVSYLLPGPQDYIHHPETERPVFGYVPSLPGLTGQNACVPVVLTEGHQSKDDTGMGAAHAWAQHRKDIEALGGHTAADTALLVARVIVEGTPLYLEVGYRSQIRLVAHRPGSGTVVLGLFKFGYHRRWQVITAHGGRGYLGDFIGEIAVSRPVQHLC
ncbi:hypothetical protein [Pseudotabrizicola formosa]|uniref:hypothetical protein n=1 Tax=Pseudotabrizicola formosa TaxID=2030009 RepID=UPI0011AECEAA|nr:hypothetical protein [Pseudotabrizicola formosa]